MFKIVHLMWKTDAPVNESALTRMFALVHGGVGPVGCRGREGMQKRWKVMYQWNASPKFVRFFIDQNQAMYTVHLTWYSGTVYQFEAGNYYDSYCILLINKLWEKLGIKSMKFVTSSPFSKLYYLPNCSVFISS